METGFMWHKNTAAFRKTKSKTSGNYPRQYMTVSQPMNRPSASKVNSS